MHAFDRQTDGRTDRQTDGQNSHRKTAFCIPCSAVKITRNSSGDEVVNVNFLYDDIVHALYKIQWTRALIPPQIDAVMCWYAGLPNSVK